MRKQPWELMRPEYIRQQMAPSSPLDDSGTMDYWAMRHKAEVRAAMIAGHPVPSDVLADYPDL